MLQFMEAIPLNL